MDKKLIGELKQKLETEKLSIQKELESFANEDKNLKHNWDTRYPNREDGDKDEEADEVQEYDNALSLEYSLELKLKDVNMALGKIASSITNFEQKEEGLAQKSKSSKLVMDKGKYGSCENCGKKIDEKRLLACPEAKTCLKCDK